MSNNSRLITGIYLSLSFCFALGLVNPAHAYVSREDIIKHNRALASGQSDDVAVADTVDDTPLINDDASEGDDSDALAPPTAVASNAKSATQRAVASEPDDSGNSGDLTVRLLDRMDAQERNMRDLRGQVEALKNEVHQKLAQNEKNLGDLKFQVDEMDKRLKGAHSVAATRSTSKAPVKAKPSAEAVARRAIANAKTPIQRAQAKYSLGSALSGQRSYKEAAVAYYDAYKQSPKSAIAPKALLGLSQSMASMGNKVPSCQALGKLKIEFPHMSPALQAQAKRLSLREKC